VPNLGSEDEVTTKLQARIDELEAELRESKRNAKMAELESHRLRARALEHELGLDPDAAALNQNGKRLKTE
jgi:hypothetical protein